MSHSTAAKSQEIFCCKCRKKTESSHLEHKTLKNGKPALSGKCNTCGTSTFTIVKGASKK
jgi:hypothetical protein